MRPLLPAKAVCRSMRLCEKLSAIEKMAGSFFMFGNSSEQLRYPEKRNRADVIYRTV